MSMSYYSLHIDSALCSQFRLRWARSCRSALWCGRMKVCFDPRNLANHSTLRRI